MRAGCNEVWTFRLSMTWNRRYQVKSYLRSSLWIIPLFALLFDHTPVIGTGVREDAPPARPKTGKYALGSGKVTVDWAREPVITHTGSNTNESCPSGY